MPWSFFTLFSEIHLADILDISIAALLLWGALQAVRTSRSRAAALGLLTFGAIVLVARQLELKLTSWLLQGIAALSVLIVVVVFQDEIRRAFERISLIWHRTANDSPVSHHQVDLLTETLEKLAATQTGALIVLPGRDPLEGLVTGGIPLGGQISTPLLLSLFDSSSPGHDGAVIISAEKVTRFAVHLPLSTNAKLLKDRGTRHAAALGLAERSDALVVVVSEETGAISVARKGNLKRLPSSHRVGGIMLEFFQEYTDPDVPLRWHQTLLRRSGLEGALALFAALGLWLLLVPGSVIMENSYQVPVITENVPTGFQLESTSPTTVEVTLSGARRKLYLLDPKKLSIRIDATLAQFGRQTFPVTPNHLLLPPELDVVNLAPKEVKVLVKKTAPESP